MTVAILHKSGKLEIYDNINTLRIENGKLFFTSGQSCEYSSTKYLDDISKVSVNGIVYYEHGEARL